MSELLDLETFKLRASGLYSRSGLEKKLVALREYDEFLEERGLEPGPESLNSWLDELVKRGLSSSTVRAYAYHVLSYFDLMMLDVDEKKVRLVKRRLPPTASSKVDYLTDDEVARLIRSTPSPVRRLIYSLMYCYDEETEVLTEDGWKRFKDLTPNDRIATLNKEGYIEYHKPVEIQRFYYEGPMIHFKGMRYDLLVTPNHRMFVRPGWKKDFCFVETWRIAKARQGSYELKRDAKWRGVDVEYFALPADDRTMKKSMYIAKYEEAMRLRREKGWGSWRISKALGVPKSTVDNWIYENRNPSNYPSNSVTNKIPINLWLKFFGWWITEGWCHYHRSNKSYEVWIRNLNNENFEEIKSIVEQMGFKYTAYPETGTIIIASKQLYSYLKQFGKARQKYIPKWIKDLPPERLEVLLNTMLKGDGSTKYRTVYITASKRLADDVQEIAIKCGYAATVGRHDRNKYYVILSKSMTTPKISRKPEIVMYRGYVYDVTVPNHVILVRRNGKAVWSGNSYARRLGEVLALTWRDVDLENGRITFTILKKRREERATYELEPWIKEMISRYRELLGKDRLFELTERAVERAFKKDCRWAGIEPRGRRLTPHILRHSRITSLREKGVPLDVISKHLVRHSRFDTTVQFYRAVTEEEKVSIPSAGEVLKVS
ncbi:MAG: tyrosine-type recombinase/integrase [Candidatus Jordarchaeales archaeon]